MRQYVHSDTQVKHLANWRKGWKQILETRCEPREWRNGYGERPNVRKLNQTPRTPGSCKCSSVGTRSYCTESFGDRKGRNAAFSPP
jgi:hypothetical protein